MRRRWAWRELGSSPSPAERDLSGAGGAQSSRGSPGGNAGVEQPWGCCFHHLWKHRALRGAPKAEAPPGKALGREELLLQAPSAPARPGLGQPPSPEEFPGLMQCWISRSAQENSRCVFLSSPPLCSVLRAGVVFTGISPSCSWFPSLPHAHPGIPWGKNSL